MVLRNSETKLNSVNPGAPGGLPIPEGSAGLCKAPGPQADSISLLWGVGREHHREAMDELPKGSYHGDMLWLCCPLPALL